MIQDHARPFGIQRDAAGVLRRRDPSEKAFRASHPIQAAWPAAVFSPAPGHHAGASGCRPAHSRALGGPTAQNGDAPHWQPQHWERPVSGVTCLEPGNVHPKGWISYDFIGFLWFSDWNLARQAPLAEGFLQPAVRGLATRRAAEQEVQSTESARDSGPKASVFAFR